MLTEKHKKWLHAATATVCVILGAAIPYALTRDNASFFYSSDHNDTVSLNWQDLQRYDYKNDILPQDIAEKLRASHTKIPGFAVPLDMSTTGIDHFLFVPSRAYCIHVPPPPPHLMIEVKMKEPVSFKDIQGALLLTGKLELTKRDTSYGEASWFLRGHRLEPYRIRSQQ